MRGAISLEGAPPPGKPKPAVQGFRGAIRGLRRKLGKVVIQTR